MAALLVSRARNMFLSSTPSSSSSRRYSPPVPFSRRRRLGRFPIPPPDNSCAGIRTQASSSSSPSSRSSSGTERKEKEEKHHELEKTNFKRGRGLDVDVRPHRYEEELREKISKAVAVLLQKRIKTTPTLLSSSGSDGSNNIEIFKSKQTNGGFRMRAVFGVHLDGPIDARYSMVEVLGTSTLPSGKIYKEKKTVLVDSFPMGSDAMRAAMPSVRSLVERDDANLRRRLFQVEFLTATSGDVVVTMCYHRKLDEEWVKAAEGMREEMNRMHPELNVSIVGRANRMRKVIGLSLIHI